MARLLIEAETGKTRFDDNLRTTIDTTLARHLPRDLLRCRWEGDVLRISGPGATGTMVFAGGRLRVRGTLRAPASLFRGVIEHKVKAAFADAFGGPAVS